MRNAFTILILACALCAPLLAEEPRKAVVLGIDALDHKLMNQWMEEGYLPNLQRLAESGHFSALETSYPPMSPTAWSTMTTGLNPGKTGIFGFIKRADGSYQPELALASVNETPVIPGGAGGRWGLAVLIGCLLFASGLALGRVLLLILPGKGAVSRPPARGDSSLAAALVVILMVLLSPFPPFMDSFARALGGLAGMGLCAVAFGCFVFRNRMRVRTFVIPVLALIFGAHMALSWIPDKLPQPQSSRTGTTFWKLADQHGLRARVIGAPVNWPAKEDLEYTRTTTGLATPDAMGTYHTYTLFTEPHHALVGLPTEMSGRVERLVFENDFAQGVLLGPPAYFNRRQWRAWEAGELQRMPRETLPFTVARTDDGVRVSLDPAVAVEEGSFDLAVGEWKRHVRVVYSLGGVARLHGTVSFKLLAGPRHVRLYATPVQFDPLEPNNRFAISEPLSFAPWLAREYGMFQTIGWAEATSALNDGLVDDETFLETCVHSFDERRDQLLGLLERADEWDLLTVFTYEVDRISHMMWRHMDESHPNHDETAPDHWRTAIRDFYVRYDNLVGEVLHKLPPNTLLLVCSDHGFAPFYRAVNLNRWLIENGYLVLKGEAGEVGMDGMFNERGGYFDPYDWSKTRAYALGLSKIYINQQGREPEGIVPPDEADALKDEIIAKLLELRDDEAHGFAKVMSGVWKREEIWEGDRLPEAGDLQIGYAWGYRVSWQTSLGGTAEPVIFDNLKNWSGDHCSFDPKLVPGVVFSNMRLDASRFWLTDAGLTAIDWLGVPLPEGRGERDGIAWTVAFASSE